MDKELTTGRKQFVTVLGSRSKTTKVTSGIPQGSVLGPLLFIIYVNELPSLVSSRLAMFADDTKLYQERTTDEDLEAVQEDLRKLEEWSEDWILPLNVNKCHHLYLSKNIPRSKGTLNLNRAAMEVVDEEVDLGVTIDSKLSYHTHIRNKIKKANSILGIIRRSFQYLDDHTFPMLFKSMVRPLLEYGASIWTPHHKYLIDEIESVQRRGTKLLSLTRGLEYEDRLRRLSLPSLLFRRFRGDMIEVYKQLTGYYDSSMPKLFHLYSDVTHISSIRGHSKKLFLPRSDSDLLKFHFSRRVIPAWNSLPELVVSSPNINTFKSRLDKLYKERNLIYTTEPDKLY